MHYSLQKTPTNGVSFSLLFNGQAKDSFNPKIEKYFERILPLCPYLSNYHLQINTTNTFPHSSGIASSASAMAALSANIIALEKMLYPDNSEQYFLQKTSELARLGSGSACRSISGSVVVWGQTPSIEHSSDYYGIPYPYAIADVFKDYQDTILLIDQGEKKVSSTVGHQLMHQHPFATNRFEQAHQNIAKLKSVLAHGDLDQFIAIVESEALTLHAMMMTSSPYFLLMKPNTLAVIEQIWHYRQQTAVPLCFTLDAGANIHLLYPKQYSQEVQQLVTDNLSAYCQNNLYINDQMGTGIAYEQ